MKIAIVTELREGEDRVAASPATVKKFVSMNCEITIESGAGATSNIMDGEFESAGATFAPDYKNAVSGADVILKVQRPTELELKYLQAGQAIICLMNPLIEQKDVSKLAKTGVFGFAMELMPRITRAQGMDVLSSQANLAGYKSVLEAAQHYRRAIPMMMTAAGTVPPARVFILGAGVAGLQAIATARRLGAVVSATDVRPATKEQIESLGAIAVFVEQPSDFEAETKTGYAREMTEDYRLRQEMLVSDHLRKQDIVITTALVPGKIAPVVITKDMVKTMKKGSIIVDLAADSGGNCALSQPGKVVDTEGVKIISYTNWPSRIAAEASQLYAKNLLNFLSPHIDPSNGDLKIDFEDETVSGVLVCRDGGVVHPLLVNKGA